MTDVRRIKELLRERVADLAPYLFPTGHREGVHWCVGSIEGERGKSFKICIAGEKAGLWGDFADSGGILRVCSTCGCARAKWISRVRCAKRLNGSVSH